MDTLRSFLASATDMKLPLSSSLSESTDRLFLTSSKQRVRKLSVPRIILLIWAIILLAPILAPHFSLSDEFSRHRSWQQNRERPGRAITEVVNSNALSPIEPNMDDDAIQDNAGSWSLPPHIHTTYKMRRDTPGVKDILERDYTRPHVFLHYTRPYPTDEESVEVFIYANGITMGDYHRNITVVGCLVGQDVYPSDTTVKITGDVFFCQVPRPIKKGALISLVVLYPGEIGTQELQAGKIGVSINATIEEHDLLPLPPGTRVYLPDALDSLLYVYSEERFDALDDDWDPDAEDSHPRYEVCLATQIKPFTNYLDSWIDYYTRLGVDMVYVLDNNSPENLSKKYEGRDEVQVLYWPFVRSQVQGLSYMTIAARSRCEWLMIADVDELPMLGIGKNNELASKQVLRRYLRRRLDSDFKQFLFPWLGMSNSGYIKSPPGPLAENYIHRVRDNQPNGKSVARTDHWWRFTVLHFFGGIPMASAPVDRNSSRLYYPVDEDDQPTTVHFHARSFEDMVIKKKFGSACTDTKQGPDPTLSFDSNVPSWVTKTDDTLKYTYFRKIFRAVMRQPFELTQILVAKSKGRRCLAQVHSAAGRRTTIVEQTNCGVF